MHTRLICAETVGLKANSTKGEFMALVNNKSDSYIFAITLFINFLLFNGHFVILSTLRRSMSCF